MPLSRDAIIFGFGFLNGPRAELSFGGGDAEFEITPRARAALQELIDAGYAAPADPSDAIPNREYYRGVAVKPSLMQLVKEQEIDLLDTSDSWKTFVRKDTAPAVKGP